MAHNHTHNDDIDRNLYPALFEVFTIILIGYLAGYFKLITSTQGQGLNKFISSFALPALIFSNLYNVEFESVNWYFINSIFITKSILFLLTLIICTIIVKPLNLGLSAVFAIFVTQSNDFALGYPIIKSVYAQSHPDYLRYIYLIAPISLCILNPCKSN
jgi:predicted permease